MSPLSQSSISEVEFQHLDQYFSLTLSPWKLFERLSEVLEKSLNLLILACMNPSYWIKLFSTLYLHCLSFYTFSPCIIVKTNNPLYTNDIFYLVWYNKLGIVHCTYLGVSDYDFHKYCVLLSEDLMLHYIRVFTVCKTTCLGFPEYKGLRQNKNMIFFNILHKFKNSFLPIAS